MKADANHVAAAPMEKQELPHQLNELLADLLVLGLKVKNYHWNLIGPTFVTWHAWLDEAAAQLKEEADALAERIRMRGEVPLGSLLSLNQHQAFLEGSLLAKEQEVIAQLQSDYQVLIHSTHAALEKASAQGDHGTADMLTATLRTAEKAHWYLSASTSN